MKRNVDYDRRVCLSSLTRDKELDSNSIICSLYFCQRVGFDLNFSFRGVSRFIQSYKVMEYIDSCIYNEDLVFCNERDTYIHTNGGNLYEVPMAYGDMEVTDKLLSLICDLDQNELSFLVTLDMLNQSLVSDKDLSTLDFAEKREYVTSTLKRLYSIYTEDIFNGACDRLKLILDLSFEEG